MQTYTREEQCRLWLQSAPSLSWRTREALLTYFGCAESIFEQMGLYYPCGSRYRCSAD